MEGPRACRPENFHETIALINQTFRAGADQDIATDYPLVFDREKLELAQLVFGSHPALEKVESAGPAGEILAQVFPYYFPIWELDHS